MFKKFIISMLLIGSVFAVDKQKVVLITGTAVPVINTTFCLSTAKTLPISNIDIINFLNIYTSFSFLNQLIKRMNLSNILSVIIRLKNLPSLL